MQVQFRLVPVIVTDEDVNPGSQVLRTHTHTSAENLGETDLSARRKFVKLAIPPT